MFKIELEKNKKKLKLENIEDCKKYLKYLIKVLTYEEEMYITSYREFGRYLAYELNKAGYEIDGEIKLNEFIMENMFNEVKLSLGFYKFKIFLSSAHESRKKIANLIGDFDRNNMSISYKNYLELSDSFKNIPSLKNNKKVKIIVKEFTLLRNYFNHFTGDKLLGWVDGRKQQKKEMKEFCGDFNRGAKFKIYIPSNIGYDVCMTEFANEIKYMKITNLFIKALSLELEMLNGKAKEREYNAVLSEIIPFLSKNTLGENKNLNKNKKRGKGFELIDKNKCILYLGHVLEYFIKVKALYYDTMMREINLLDIIAKEEGFDIKGETVGDVIKSLKGKKINLSSKFGAVKTFQLAIQESRKRILNISGDFSFDKRAISYNNYLSVIKEKKIEGVTFRADETRDSLLEELKKIRNEEHHYSIESLVADNINEEKFIFGDDFTVKINENLDFFNKINEVEEKMICDFEWLIGEKIEVKFETSSADTEDFYFVNEITKKGFENHLKNNI